MGYMLFCFFSKLLQIFFSNSNVEIGLDFLLVSACMCVWNFTIVRLEFYHLHPLKTLTLTPLGGGTTRIYSLHTVMCHLKF